MATTCPIAAATDPGARRVRPLGKHLSAYLMCAPTLLLFLVFMVFPILFVLYASPAKDVRLPSHPR